MKMKLLCYLIQTHLYDNVCSDPIGQMSMLRLCVG